MDLYSRIQAARTGEKGRLKPRRPLLDCAPGPDWERLAVGVYRREVRIAPEAFAQDRMARPLSPVLRPLASFHDLLAIDLETTGLSGGAGNVAFLAGFGRVAVADEGVEAVVRQVFLSDFGAEGDFVAALADEIGRDERVVYVTYNGAAFDIPVLRTRFLMGGRPFPERPHLDLLPVARRLWRHSLPDCRLGTVEAHVTGQPRTDDLPGALAPFRYREFHRLGDPWPLAEVIEHHRRDVRALLDLLARTDALLSEAGAPGTRSEGDTRSGRNPVADPDGLFYLLLARGGDADRTRAFELARQLHADGALRRTRPERWAALTRLYLDALRRRGTTRDDASVAEAAIMARHLWEARLAGSDAIRLAKHQEHALKNAGAALQTCRELEASRLLKEADRPALVHRMARLHRLVERGMDESRSVRKSDS